MNQDMNQLKFLVSPGRRVAMLLLTFVAGAVITGFASGIIMNLGGEGNMVAMMRIATVVQDIFMLILPALVTALIVTRQPVRLLALAPMPTGRMTLLAIVVMLVASPAMSWIIRLNASLHLPESMAGIEAALRAMEDAAEGTVQMMLGSHTPGNLIMNVLIIGVMAGFSEELFFRGALQRLLGTTRMSQNAAVWIAAIVFSAVHFQFFGFVPRMLLGAFFGYLLVWSGSVWLPMLIHTLNNTLFVVLKHFTGSGDPQLGEAGEGTVAVIVSALLTSAGIYLLYRQRIKGGVQ